MGGMCSGGEDEADKKFTPGGDNDLSNGPKTNRGCTDIACVPIFLFAQVVWVVVTIMGMQDGNPSKLYEPRDYRGAYCGVKDNWNGGPNTEKQQMLGYTMNISSTMEEVMLQLVCSSAAKAALIDGDDSAGINPLITDATEKDDYLCDCCLTPCAKCDGSLQLGGDLSSPQAISDTIGARMSEFTDPAKTSELFSPSGDNADKFTSTNFWNEATKWFNMVCVSSCGKDSSDTLTADAANARDYTYVPSPDSEFYGYWNLLKDPANNNAMTSVITSTIEGSFTFKALPEADCPYEPELCIPFPGVTFKEAVAGSDYCTMEMAAEVVSSVGDAAASAFAGLGGDAFSGVAEETFGKWYGDFQVSFDTFIVVCFLAFAIALLFLVLLRFFVGVCVWIAVFSTVLFYVFGGCFAFTLSGQCEGAGILETGTQNAVAITVAASTTASNAVTGTDTVSEEVSGENDSGYRGVQYRTKNGFLCQDWDTQTVMPTYTSTTYPDSGLEDNYCRNPFQADAVNKAKTIWCVTSDADVPWEECIPIGVIQPECADGYQINPQEMRDALFYTAFVIWGLGVIWLIIVICLVDRIRLAIAINKVAAQFVGQNPTVTVVPIVQAFFCIFWCASWFWSVSFLLSQVPDDYTPKGYFATYQEAYGTSGACAFWEYGDECNGTPGKCTDSWPTGFTWKDSECETTSNGSVNCWRCAPPRYVLDLRFAISFFVFLWNNAFNVALGQICIAMTCGFWFFTQDKGNRLVPIVPKALKTVFRYHLGTVAFGSFIVAVVQFIRYLMKYFEKQAAAQKNRCMVILLKCVQCCIWCFEKCIQFLNKNAYIQTALMGTNFCTSAKKAFYLILRNALRFGTIAALSGVIHAIGFLFIMTGTGVSGYLLMRLMHPDISPFIPICCYLCVSYGLSQMFMSVFGLAVDTILQCFLATEEMGVGAEYVPSVLRNFLDNNNKNKAES